MPPNSSRCSSYNLIRERTQRNKCITVLILGIAIFFILLAYVAFGDTPKYEPTLKLVYVVFRHGDRNPTDTYPNDPYNSLSNWPGGWGALTKKGKLQMYNLGDHLRSKYKNMIGDTYSPDHILVRSSDNDRCLMSVGALLAGLLPPSESEIWHPQLPWQPIPVHATPRNLDKLIVVKKPCPQYEKALQDAYKSPEIMSIDEENEELYKYLTEHTGQSVSNVLDVELLYNTLEIEENAGYDLPPWTKSVYPDKMRALAETSVAIFTHSPIMKRFVGGPLLDDMSKKMVQKSAGTLKPDRTAYLISGHDMTLVNLIRSLGFKDRLKPEIGATLLFELHAGTPNEGPVGDFIKILYLNTSATAEPHEMKIPSCGSPCLLTDFVNLLKPVLITPDEWETECQA